MGVDSWGRGVFSKKLGMMMMVVLWFHEWTRGMDHHYQRVLLVSSSFTPTCCPREQAHVLQGLALHILRMSQPSFLEMSV